MFERQTLVVLVHNEEKKGEFFYSSHGEEAEFYFSHQDSNSLGDSREHFLLVWD